YDTDRSLADPLHEEVGDYWKAVDVSFESAFTSQITKALSVSLIAQFVYDKFDSAANLNIATADPALDVEIARNLRKKGQFREVLALGLTMRLF
ncbi:MAG TPA: hypothetical protein VFU59_09210, partial [Candidatus Eisenbacteria bacterium]|nr:hypothetical protein [Candidatus Eisenbacteria bacterium]